MLTVHPHGCGEHSRPAPFVITAYRFTPTGVGSISISAHTFLFYCGSPPRVWGASVDNLGVPYLTPVHPHGCGEHERPFSDGQRDRRFTPTGVGSMPDGYSCEGGVQRFTPTGVGSIHPLGHLQTCQLRFTPHGCGEHISAYLRDRWQAAAAVHPHGCGEHDALLAIAAMRSRFTPTGVGSM